MTFQELENIIQQHMLLADRHIVRLLCAFIVAARMKINPPWLFIVGPPAGGKSMLLQSLHSCKGIFPLDDLTASTFASGMRGKDGESNSLLDKLDPNSIILFKDFTTIISKDAESRGIVIGQMRKIYDGDFSKIFGNGMKVNFNAKPPAVLAGVTEKIYPSMSMFADMGERFLMYNFIQPDRKAVGHIAAANLDDAVSKKVMKDAFTQFIESVPIPSEIERIDQTTENQIVDLAEFVTRARTPVERNKYTRNQRIDHIYNAEMPGRFVKQVLGIALGLRAIRPDHQVHDEDRKMLCSIALDSIPSIRRTLLRALTRYDEGIQTRALALELHYDTDSLGMHLQDLEAMEVVERTNSMRRDFWQIKYEYRKIIETYEGIHPTGRSLELSEVETPLPEEEIIDIENENSQT